MSSLCSFCPLSPQDQDKWGRAGYGRGNGSGEEARQGQSFPTASTSDISGGVDGVRGAEVLNFSSFAGRDPRTTLQESQVMIKSPKVHRHWWRSTQSWEAGPGTWGARRSSHSDPKDSVERAGSSRVLSCTQKPLGLSPCDPSFTQASPGGKVS